MDGREAEEGEPILTRGWSLPSGYVLHVAGPKLERGAAPTEEEDELLAASYRNSLDLAEEVSLSTRNFGRKLTPFQLGGIDAVAFPCISTGLFAFPGSAASIIALRTVNAWIDSHPESPTRAIFVLFSAADANHYLAATSHLFPSLPTPLPLTPHVALSPKVLEWMKESDAVIIHAGAGLSGNAVRADLGMGLDYNSKELFKTLYPDLLKTTDNLTTLYHSIGYGFDDVRRLSFASQPSLTSLRSLSSDGPSSSRTPTPPPPGVPLPSTPPSSTLPSPSPPTPSSLPTPTTSLSNPASTAPRPGRLRDRTRTSSA